MRVGRRAIVRACVRACAFLPATFLTPKGGRGQVDNSAARRLGLVVVRHRSGVNGDLMPAAVCQRFEHRSALPFAACPIVYDVAADRALDVSPAVQIRATLVKQHPTSDRVPEYSHFVVLVATQVATVVVRVVFDAQHVVLEGHLVDFTQYAFVVYIRRLLFHIVITIVQLEQTTDLPLLKLEQRQQQ